jgi:hypothetical protein
MSEELKPCPFCGERHDLEVQYIDRRDREGQPVCIKCGKCGCSGPWDYCSSPAPSELEEFAAASKLWNARHESDELPVWFVNRIKTIISDVHDDLNKNLELNFITGRTDDAIRQCDLLNFILTLRKPEAHS